MSCHDSLKMSPWGGSCGSHCRHNGNINHECERTATRRHYGGSASGRTQLGGPSGRAGAELPADQAGVATVSGRRRCGVSTPVARPPRPAPQAAGAACAGAGAACPAVSGLWPHPGGGVSGPGGLAGGSRDAAALAAGRGPMDRAPTAATPPAMARAQTVLWRHGATGWFAPRLVRGTAGAVCADGDGG
ncbi:MAG: hypothetical protein BWX84_03245 [Verrucomicrobia bacterium ADurb.Bin118]|nr:MAG: hypothetical protein BWX84_03245 [Verrucomicrobia bacterium ADurb.Bin118]